MTEVCGLVFRASVLIPVFVSALHRMGPLWGALGLFIGLAWAVCYD